MVAKNNDRSPRTSGPAKALAVREEQRRRRLSIGTRIVFFALGWTLLLVGVAGLALPGIQGILTILVGVAVLSVASESAYRLLKRLLHRWPALWNRIERFRERIHDWLHRDGGDGEDGGA